MLIGLTQQIGKLVFVRSLLSLRDQCAHWSRNDRKLGGEATNTNLSYCCVNPISIFVNKQSRILKRIRDYYEMLAAADAVEQDSHIRQNQAEDDNCNDGNCQNDRVTLDFFLAGHGIVDLTVCRIVLHLV